VQEKEKNKTVSQWMFVNNMQHVLKATIGLLTVYCFVITTLCFTLQDKTPIVAKDVNGEIFYLSGEKKKIPVQKGNIRRLIDTYIKLRYEWDGKLNIEKVTRNISPFVTEGFRRKTKAMLKHLKDKEFKGKKLDQGHTKARVQVTDKKTIAQFDRVLRINDIPVPIPTQISFEIVRGEVSVWNLLGLYINGVTIHEGN
jgi:hypothetical protein